MAAPYSASYIGAKHAIHVSSYLKMNIKKFWSFRGGQ
jgi:hypothetical protein